jgi:lysophospholipase L1-like esterase
MKAGSSLVATALITFLLGFATSLKGQVVKPAATSQVENSTALKKFFEALDQIKSGRRLEPVRIMHFGDSHVAADVLTRAIRERFQSEFGDGGTGYIVPRNPMATRRRGVSAGATGGWVIEGIGGRYSLDRIYGPAGINLMTTRAGERAWLAANCNHFEVYFARQPGAGKISITVDGAEVLNHPISTESAVPQLDSVNFDLPQVGFHRLELKTLGTGKVRLLGIVAENISPGIVYDVFGINGATANRILSWNEKAFEQAVKLRSPDLIIIAYGTNELTDRDWTAASYTEDLGQVVKRIRKAAPGASILFFGPPDRSDVFVGGRLQTITSLQRRVALSNNAAFWSAYQAMGGSRAMNRWVVRGLAQPDKVHLTTAGYEALANRFYDDLITIRMTETKKLGDTREE